MPSFLEIHKAEVTKLVRDISDEKPQKNLTPSWPLESC